MDASCSERSMHCNFYRYIIRVTQTVAQWGEMKAQHRDFTCFDPFKHLLCDKRPVLSMALDVITWCCWGEGKKSARGTFEGAFSRLISKTCHSKGAKILLCLYLTEMNRLIGSPFLSRMIGHISTCSTRIISSHILGAFPPNAEATCYRMLARIRLQICTKLEQYFRNADKTQLQNDCFH